MTLICFKKIYTHETLYGLVPKTLKLTWLLGRKIANTFKMVWRARIGYFIRTYGLGTAGAITALSILLHEKSKDKNVAYSAKREWSYSFEPSVKWDYNWDRYESYYLFLG